MSGRACSDGVLAVVREIVSRRDTATQRVWDRIYKMDRMGLLKALFPEIKEFPGRGVGMGTAHGATGNTGNPVP